MWVKKPSRVPGRSHTVLTLASVSRIDMACVGTARPFGVFLTSAMVSTIDSTPMAATET